MKSLHWARTGTLTTVSLRLLFTLGMLVSLSGAVYLPEDGPPLPLTDSGDTPADIRNPTDDGILTVIPGKIKPPPSERVPNWPVHSVPRDDGCLDTFLARTKRAVSHVRVTETDDAVITDIITNPTKREPVRQIIRQPSHSPKFVCPEEWRGLDLSDPSVLECPENATGFFPFPPDCRKYLNCWRGRSAVQPCAPATYFDPVRRECDYPEKVKCLPDCYTGNANHQTDLIQRFEDGSGNNGNQHSGIQNAIDGDRDTQSPGGNEGFGARNPDNRGSLRPAKGYVDLSHGDQDTVTDSYGVDPTLYVDPYDPSAHSPLLDVRDLPTGKVSRVRPNAGNQARRPNYAAQPASVGQKEQRNNRSRRYVYTQTSSKYCSMEGGTGLAPDPDDCSRFYNCAHGRAYRQDCAPGTLFSERLGNCDHSHLVNCGSRPRQRSQIRVPTPPTFRSYDSYSAGSGRQEVQVPYPRPTTPSFPAKSGRNIYTYQPTDARNPDAGYQPSHGYQKTPVSSPTPKPVFFRPPNYHRTDLNHQPHEHFQHNHSPNEPFHHNHPPQQPFHHNHPPNTHFHHNHPPPQSPYFQHNHQPITRTYPTINPPNYTPTQHTHNSPPFNTALNPTQNHRPYNPSKESRINPEENSTPASPEDDGNYDQSPQGSSPIEDRRPNRVSSSTEKTAETGNQGPKWDTKKLENSPSHYPGDLRDPYAQEDRWNIPPEIEQSPTPCPTTSEHVEGAADRDAWINLVNKTRNARSPMAGQWVRLRGGRSFLEGHVEILGPGAVWGGVCDAEGEWNIEKASIVCKQLGFERGAETAWQGGSTSNKPTHVNSITCGEGAPTLLHCALQRGWGEYACDTLTRAVNVRCLPNWTSKCQPGETLRGDRCYRLFKPTVEMTDLAHSASEAVEHCRSRGGHIVDVNSQAENDFLTDWLASEHPDVDAILTSGIGVRVIDVARDLWVWQTDNYSPMGFCKWWPGWNGTGVSRPSVGDRTVCVLLQKTYPCDGRRSEMCSADYMYWHAVDCAQRGTLYPYICERKGDDIGCVDGTAEYKGTANVTANGRVCLPWNDERVVSEMRFRITEQTQREALNGHNYCRKVYGNREPWCYVDYGHGIGIRSEDCHIPPCWDRGTHDVGSQTDSDEFWQSSNPTETYAIPWQYASNFPHREYAVFASQDEGAENTVEPKQGSASLNQETKAGIPFETAFVDSGRPSTGREYHRVLVSTTTKPDLTVPEPIVSPRPTWSRTRQNRNGRFTTTPSPTLEPEQGYVTSALSPFDEIFGSPTPAPSYNQYPSYTSAPPNTVRDIPYPSNGPKSPHVFENPQYPKIRHYTIKPSNYPSQEFPYTDPHFPEVNHPNTTNHQNPRHKNPQGTQHSELQTTQHPQTTQEPQSYPRPNFPEIPLDVDDSIPDQLLHNPVMPPSYPDGRPPIPSDEKPPIAARGGFPKATANTEEQENELLNNENEELEKGVTSFNKLLRILHQRYGKPNRPQSLNGHTGPMGWYSPTMISPPRSARSPEDGLSAAHNPLFRSDVNESENIMKIAPKQPREKGSTEPVPRYYM